MAKKRAFVKYTKSGEIIPGSLIVTTKGGYPKDGLYKEVTSSLCCDDVIDTAPYGGRIPVTYTGLLALDKIYDGNNVASFTGLPTLVGVLPEDIGNLQLTENLFGNFLYADPTGAVGNNKLCYNVDYYILTGTALSKYILVNPLYYSNILPLP